MLDLIQPFVNLPLAAFNAGDSVWNSFGGLCRNSLHTISAISTLRFIVDTLVNVTLSQIVLAISNSVCLCFRWCWVQRKCSFGLIRNSVDVSRPNVMNVHRLGSVGVSRQVLFLTIWVFVPLVMLMLKLDHKCVWPDLQVSENYEHPRVCSLVGVVDTLVDVTLSQIVLVIWNFVGLCCRCCCIQCKCSFGLIRNNVGASRQIHK